MLVRHGTFQSDPDVLDPLIAPFERRGVPAYSALPGFLGYQALVDRESGRYIGLSFWESQAAFDASVETALMAVQGAAALGARVVGEPVLLEVAFDTRS